MNKYLLAGILLLGGILSACESSYRSETERILMSDEWLISREWTYTEGQSDKKEAFSLGSLRFEDKSSGTLVRPNGNSEKFHFELRNDSVIWLNKVYRGAAVGEKKKFHIIELSPDSILLENRKMEVKKINTPEYIIHRMLLERK